MVCYNRRQQNHERVFLLRERCLCSTVPPSLAACLRANHINTAQVWGERFAAGLRGYSPIPRRMAMAAGQPVCLALKAA